jgi:hypothetical protein
MVNELQQWGFFGLQPSNVVILPQPRFHGFAQVRTHACVHACMRAFCLWVSICGGRKGVLGWGGTGESWPRPTWASACCHPSPCCPLEDPPTPGPWPTALRAQDQRSGRLMHAAPFFSPPAATWRALYPVPLPILPRARRTSGQGT